jgi:hypothetical protein
MDVPLHFESFVIGMASTLNTYMSSSSASSFRHSSQGNISGSGTKKWVRIEHKIGGTEHRTSELG